MRRSLLPLLLLGCGLLRFSAESTSQSTVEGAGLLGQVLSTLDFTGLDDFEVTIADEMADQGVEPGDLESVVVTEITLTAEPDLSFIESLEIYVSGPGVDEVLVASAHNFPEGQAEVALTMSGKPITEAVVAGDISWRAEVTGSAPVDDVELEVYVSVDIEATAQGACRAAGG